MSLKAKLTACMEQAVENHETAGLNVLIVKNGEEVCYAEAGMADIAAGKKISRDSIFRLYSQSKPVTAAAVLLLVERGVIDLLDGADKYLPGFRDPKILMPDGSLAPALRPPRVVELLGMTAGLSYPAEDPVGQYAARVFDEDQKLIRDGGGMDTVTFCNRLGELPLAFEPGTHWRYSTCADILGAIVEVASGRRFGDFLRDEFFGPLDMKDTGFWVPEEKRERLVTCYRQTAGGMEEFHQMHLAVGIYDKAPAFESGGAGLVSTADDYLAFAQMLLNGGTYRGKRILAEETVRYLSQPLLTPDVRKDMWDTLGGYNYGKLVRVCTEPGALPHFGVRNEYGWDGWLGTYFMNMPDLGVTFLLNQNTVDAGTTFITRKCRNIAACGGIAR